MKALKIAALLLAVMTISMALIGAEAKNYGHKAKTKNVPMEEETGFSDRRVLIVLDRETSLEFKTYSAEDFSEINCVGVTDLTIDAEEKAKKSFEEGLFKDPNEIAFNKILCLELGAPGMENVLGAIALLLENEHVLSAEPDYIISVSNTPNDTHYSHQWGNDKISLPSAWNQETGSSSIIVGVIDTGIDGTHPDLSSRIKTAWCRSFLTGTAVSETSPTDPMGHGTLVAGIIGAAGNNGIGICGTCWNIRMVSLKAIAGNGYGYSSNAIAAISFAEGKGIPILNLSASWDCGEPLIASYYNSPMKTAIDNYSGLLICAAGNDSKNIDSTSNHIYPAKYTSSNLLVVGSCDIGENKANSSNYGTISVDIFAPGINILSTFPTSMCTTGNHSLGTHYKNGYHYMNGTSMAAPYVTGVAALIKACHPNITVSQLKSAIINNGDYQTTLNNYCLTGNRLNAFKALDSTHSYSYANYNNTYHKCTCSLCGYITYKAHDWVLNANHTSYHCSICGAITTAPGYPTSLWDPEARAVLYDVGVLYGEVNGCTVRFLPGVLAFIDIKDIAGYKFIWHSAFQIAIERGGEIYGIEDAYKLGLLSKEDIAEIYRLHKDYVTTNIGVAELYKENE